MVAWSALISGTGVFVSLFTIHSRLHVVICVVPFFCLLLIGMNALRAELINIHTYTHTPDDDNKSVDHRHNVRT